MADARRLTTLSGLSGCAVESNNLNDIRRHVAMGADVNYVLRSIHRGKEVGTTPLIQAAALGHAAIVSELLGKGADVNLQEPCQGTGDCCTVH